MRIIISSHADQRIQQRLTPLLHAHARGWVQTEVKQGQLASTSPAWHGRKRIYSAARRFIRTHLDRRGVLIVVERVTRDILRIVTVIVEGSTTAMPHDNHRRITPAHIGRPVSGNYPPATAPLMALAA